MKSHRHCITLVSVFVLVTLAVGAAAAQPTAAPKKPEAGKSEPAKKEAAEGKSAEPESADEEKPEPASLSDSLTGMAKAEYGAGRILFTDGDYAGAKLKFERAFELSKDARLWWNVAAAEKNLRNYSRVIRALERYLADGGELLSESDRTDARSLIETMNAFVARVSITTEPTGAKVSIDGEAVGSTPFAEPLLVDQGSRTLRVEKQGFMTLTETRKLPGGETVELAFKLRPEIHEGRLRVIAGPGDVISVDGRVVGKGTWEGKLKSGVHSVSVTAPGKRAYQTDVVVQDDQLSTSRIALESEAKPEEGGFFAGPWPWVIGGVVVAAGAGVGTYFAVRGDESSGPNTVAGTLPPRTIQLPLGF